MVSSRHCKAVKDEAEYLVSKRPLKSMPQVNPVIVMSHLLDNDREGSSLFPFKFQLRYTFCFQTSTHPSKICRTETTNMHTNLPRII